MSRKTDESADTKFVLQIERKLQLKIARDSLTVRHSSSSERRPIRLSFKMQIVPQWIIRMAMTLWPAQTTRLKF